MLHLYFWNYSIATKPIALKFGGKKECRSPRLNVQFLSENVCPSCFNWTFNFWCNISWWMTVHIDNGYNYCATLQCRYLTMTLQHPWPPLGGQFDQHPSQLSFLSLLAFSCHKYEHEWAQHQRYENVPAASLLTAFPVFTFPPILLVVICGPTPNEICFKDCSHQQWHWALYAVIVSVIP